jgi:methionine-rich copper-binding protein CopC
VILRPASPRRLLLGAAGALFGAAVAAAFATTIVLAHARFDHATPSPGQVLTTAPARVDIFTAQDMRKTAGANDIAVAGPDNSRVDDGNTVVDDANRRHFSVGLKPNLPNGRYLVSFKTLSDEDGEADHGQYAFYIGAQPTAQQVADDKKLTQTAKTDAAPSSSHTGLYVGIAVAVVVIALLLIGGAIAMMRRRRSRV